MQNEHRFALMLARLVDLLRQGAGRPNERRAALHAIVDATKTRSSTVRLEENTLSVEGIAAPQDVPFVKTLIAQMNAHGIAEIRVAHRAAPVDVVELALALASPPSEQPIAQTRREAPVGTVQLITSEEAKLIWDRCKMPVTDELLGGSGQVPTAAPVSEPVREQHRELPPDFVPAGEGAALRQMMELKEASSTSLAFAVRKLRDVHDDQAELSKGLNAIAAGVVTAVRESRVPEAIDAIIGVIRQEHEEQREEIHLRYGVALRRVLQPEVLLPLIDYLLDPLYDKDVAEIMRRGGTRGAQMLLDRLVAATTFAERRAYMEALRQIDAGTEQVVGMLKHHEWFVVRNIADLVGEMRIEEGVAALGQAAKHDDDRVRLSAGLALAKIGTPAASKYLGGLLRDKDHRIRSEIAKQVKGRGLGALAMPLVNAAESEENENVRAEFYRALGRIGTPDAVQALIRTAKPKGFLKGFGQGLPGIKSDGVRLAAAEGLGLAGGRMSLDALEQLSHDRDRGVREAARKGLAALRARPDRGEGTNTTMSISAAGAQKLETPAS